MAKKMRSQSAAARRARAAKVRDLSAIERAGIGGVSGISGDPIRPEETKLLGHEIRVMAVDVSNGDTLLSVVAPLANRLQSITHPGKNHQAHVASRLREVADWLDPEAD